MFDEPRPVNYYTALAPRVLQAPAQVWTTVKRAVWAVQTRELRAVTCQRRGHVPKNGKRLICRICKKKRTITGNTSTVSATQNKDEYVPVYASM